MEWTLESGIMGGCHCRDCVHWTGYRVIDHQRVFSGNGKKLANGYWRKRCEATDALVVDVHCCEKFEDKNNIQQK